MTTNVPATDDTTPNYRDRNDELFAARAEILATIDAATATAAGAEAGTVDAALAKRTLRKARRALDDNTTALVDANIGLVRSQVRRFTQTATADQRADYEAAGTAGLLAAINSFQSDKGNFSSWAFKPIKRNIHSEVHRNEHQTLGQSDFERRPAILRARAALVDAGETITPAAVAAEVERAVGIVVTEAQVTRVIDAPRIGTLDATLSEDGATIGDLIADRSVDVAASAIGSLPTRMPAPATSRTCWPHLDATTRTIVAGRYGLDADLVIELEALAAQIGISAAAVDAADTAAVSAVGRALIDVPVGVS